MRFPKIVAAALTLVLKVLPAAAECTLSAEEVKSSYETSRLIEQFRYIHNDTNAPEADGFILSRQAPYLDDAAGNREMFDCLFDAVERGLGGWEAGFQAGSPHVVRQENTIERFRAAALGLLDDDALRALGIDPTREIPSIFSSAKTAKGSFDPAVVCLGNGLKPGCAVPVNELSLTHDPKTDTLDGRASVQVNRPNEFGCGDWASISNIVLSANFDARAETTVAGVLTIRTRVTGFTGKKCTAFDRTVPIDGTWTAAVTDDGITGQIVTPGAKGPAEVPFRLTWQNKP
ncbi:hypothetical protein [Marimonas arenosa]|uniref:Uncharacterized protein n=1 Tax=Marimonas arenosa TaxID=1795305 RepID=A0AAE4B390_9RHOB|nr:hypothetical protein [Marimonas arenosa]MDQ2089808.1 hypothetical protein [Marimonas arenosa]